MKSQSHSLAGVSHYFLASVILICIKFNEVGRTHFVDKTGPLFEIILFVLFIQTGFKKILK